MHDRMFLGESDPRMAEFAARLRDLLASSEIEQRKEIIMRDAIAKQLEAV